MKLTYWKSSTFGGRSGYAPGEEELTPVGDRKDAELLGSALPSRDPVGLRGGQVQHVPVLDIDHKCYLRQSETPGHYHLVIDKPMSWSDYKELLTVMAKVGILEEGYVGGSIRRGMTNVALRPWKHRRKSS